MKIIILITLLILVSIGTATATPLFQIGAIPQIVYSPAPIEVVAPPYYNATTPETVADFLREYPYEGKGQCVSRSRYLAIEAQAHNLSLGTCIIGGNGGAQVTEKHQVNTFEYEGARYYTTNLYAGDVRVCDGRELLIIMNEILPSGLHYLHTRGFWSPQAKERTK